MQSGPPPGAYGIGGGTSHQTQFGAATSYGVAMPYQDHAGSQYGVRPPGATPFGHAPQPGVPLHLQSYNSGGSNPPQLPVIPLRAPPIAPPPTLPPPPHPDMIMHQVYYARIALIERAMFILFIILHQRFS